MERKAWKQKYLKLEEIINYWLELTKETNNCLYHKNYNRALSTLNFLSAKTEEIREKQEDRFTKRGDYLKYDGAVKLYKRIEGEDKWKHMQLSQERYPR